MKPYYEEDGITIYHGDCRELLPTLQADLVLTDPPYGIRADEAAAANKGQWGWRDYGASHWDQERPDADLLNLVVGAAPRSVVWGGNYMADLLSPSSCWLAWDKGQRSFSLADFELAWTNYPGAARMVVVPRGRALQDGKVHPTQKSLSVMRWCITEIADKRGRPPSLVLDPFMGSGTTLRAAKDLGRRAIGVEIEERYCEIAVQRLAQGVFSFD